MRARAAGLAACVAGLAFAGCGTGTEAILSVYLHQRGSPESKPVGSPHDVTGAEG